MLCIKIELWPFGDEDSSREIGRMYVANDGSGTVDRGNYDVWVCRKGTTERPPNGTYTRKARVKDYPRKSYTVWRLIKRALTNAFD
jgi:hypothetical protein